MTEQARQVAQSLPAQPTRTLRSGLLQRACACGNHAGGGECAACREKREGTLQRSALQPSAFSPHPSVAPPIVHDVLRKAGQPLDSATRAFMEPRFGHDFSRVPTRTTAPQLAADLTVGPTDDRYEQEADRVAHTVMRAPQPGTQGQASGVDFSQVRVHTDPQAHAAAAAVNARAYTVGRDIVFGAGQYAPQTAAGRQLLAHELTHTIQQAGSAPPQVQRLTAAEKKEDLKSKRLKDDKRLQRAFDNSPAMRKNETGEGVKTLQRALRDLDYPMPISFKNGDADGIFGDETFDTVQQFQLDHKLVDHDGVVGRETLRALDDMYATTLTLKSIGFTSAHAPMKDNRASWDDTGPAFPQPEWTATTPDGKSAPISHRKNEAVKVDVTLDVSPATVSGVPVKLKGLSAQPFLTFEQSSSMSGGNDQTISMTSTGTIPDAIDDQYQKQTIDWSADVIGENQVLGQSLEHDIFVTYDTPKGGVTYKRMAKATELTKGFGNGPHDIVSGEMKRFPFYNLKKPYSGNIWPLADAIPDSAECQSIVRFVQAVNDMVGVPGIARGISVFAAPSAPDVPLIGILLATGGATGAMANFPPQPGTGHRAFLFDGGDNANNYEAALEFESGSKLYYPGGVPGGVGLKTTLEVLHSFKKMSWSNFDVAANRFVPVALIHCYHPPC